MLEGRALQRFAAHVFCVQKVDGKCVRWVSPSGLLLSSPSVCFPKKKPLIQQTEQFWPLDFVWNIVNSKVVV